MPRSDAAIARRAAKRGKTVAEQAKVDALAARTAIQKKRQLTREAGGRKGFAEQRRKAKGNTMELSAPAVSAPTASASAASVTAPDHHMKRRTRSPEAMARRETKRRALELAKVAATDSAPLSVGNACAASSTTAVPAAPTASTSGTGKRRKRSPEAMARREAKRIALGLGVTTTGFSTSAHHRGELPTETQKKKKKKCGGVAEKPEREVWTCSSCGLSGIWGTRFRCRDCGQPRYDRKKMDRSWVDPKVAGGWKIEQPSSQKLRQNAELREMYKNDPESMSEEDRNRAEVLIRRTARKKKKKAKAKAAFLAKKNSSKKKEKNNPNNAKNKDGRKAPRINLNLPSSMDR